MTGILYQTGQVFLVLLGIAWSIVVFFHTITFPLDEASMRQIVREEVRKILIQEKQR